MDKVNQLVILGNGFDLNCGLKSSFEGYLNIIRKREKIDSTVSMLKKYSVEELQFFNRIYNSEFIIGTDSPQKIDENSVLFKILERVKETNFWALLFNLNDLDYLKQNGRDRDCSLKGKIDHYVLNYENCISGFLTKNVLTDECLLAAFPSKYIKLLLSCQSSEDFKIIKEKSLKYFFHLYTFIQMKVCFVEIGQADESFRVKNLLLEKNSYYHFKLNFNYEILDFLFKQLQDFIKGFATFLFNQIRNNNDYSVKSNKKISRIIGKNYSDIISFNYTNPFYGNKYIKKVCNINGTLKNPIMGINSNNIDYNAENLVIFCKTYQILNRGTYKKSGLPKNIDKIIFYGHSLTFSDFEYFESIFDYYQIYSSKIKLIFEYSYYVIDDNKNKTLKRQLDYISDRQTFIVERLINDYGKTFNNKSHGKNLLHKLLLEKRLILKCLK